MGLFGSLLGFGGPAKSVTPAPGTMFSEIADTFGAGIANCRDFEQQIAPAVAGAIDYFDKQIAAIPGSIGISASEHGSDPVVTALFPSSDEIRVAIGRSIEIRETLPALAASGHVVGHALLGVRCKAKDQTPGQAPMFVDHTLKCLTPSELETRQAIRFAAGSRAVRSFAEHLDKLRKNGTLLAEEWTTANDSAGPGDRLRGIKEFLFSETDISAENLLKGLSAWLKKPADHLRVSMNGVRITYGPGHIDLPVLHAADRRQWVVCIVEFPVEEAMAAVRYETRSHRYIFI